MKLEKKKKKQTNKQTNKKTKLDSIRRVASYVQNPFLDLSKKTYDNLSIGFKNTDLDFSKEANAVNTTLDCLALLVPYR